MKKLLTITACLLCLSSYAQDTLFTELGEVIPCQIETINPDKITYLTSSGEVKTIERIAVESYVMNSPRTIVAAKAPEKEIAYATVISPSAPTFKKAGTKIGIGGLFIAAGGAMLLAGYGTKNPETLIYVLGGGAIMVGGAFVIGGGFQLGNVQMGK